MFLFMSFLLSHFLICCPNEYIFCPLSLSLSSLLLFHSWYVCQLLLVFEHLSTTSIYLDAIFMLSHFHCSRLSGCWSRDTANRLFFLFFYCCSFFPLIFFCSLQAALQVSCVTLPFSLSVLAWLDRYCTLYCFPYSTSAAYIICGEMCDLIHHKIGRDLSRTGNMHDMPYDIFQLSLCFLQFVYTNQPTFINECKIYLT